MLPRLLRCLAAALLVFSMALPFAAGQNNLPTIDRGVSKDAVAADEEKSGSSASVLSYFVMVLYSMLILTIVCMPNRQA